MALETADIIERVVLSLATRGVPLSSRERAEFGRALTDLAARIERAAEILHQLVELVNPRALPGDLHLTPRELEILTHLADGRSNGEIAKQCWISENTVKFHVKNLFRKLGVQDRGQTMMIARAMRRKLDHSP